LEGTELRTKTFCDYIPHRIAQQGGPTKKSRREIQFFVFPELGQIQQNGYNGQYHDDTPCTIRPKNIQSEWRPNKAYEDIEKII
ncbi:MAG: hypothetical protein II670_10495, partial [Alphaproteobacteria bacterium]|nr:hypothetical protein [Alphaproteobacteria bacterium]